MSKLPKELVEDILGDYIEESEVEELTKKIQYQLNKSIAEIKIILLEERDLWTTVWESLLKAKKIFDQKYIQNTQAYALQIIKREFTNYRRKMWAKRHYVINDSELNKNYSLYPIDGGIGFRSDLVAYSKQKNITAELRNDLVLSDRISEITKGPLMEAFLLFKENYSIEEVAEIIKKSERTIRRWKEQYRELVKEIFETTA